MLKRLLIVSMFLLLAALFALAWTFFPQRLPMPAPYVGALPAASPPAGMTISTIHTGSMASRAAFAFRGGAFGEERQFAMTAILLRHPQGDLLIDSGFGQDVETHVATTPRLAQALTRFTRGTPAGAQLQAQKIEVSSLAGVVLTHAHWDHVSGLDSLPGAPVWTNAAERAFVREGGDRSALLRSFTAVRWIEYAFDDGPYFGFEQSYDVWDDGSVVLVPAPGHTPGSVIVFVALPSGTRYALLGDLVWQSEGITRPAERPWFVRRMLGEDEALVRAAIARIAAIHQRYPEIRLVPAHDGRALASIPTFPNAAR